MKKISVIGAGTMGTGIAQLAATHGCIVNLIDSAPDALHHSKSNLHSVLNRLIAKVKISEVDSKNILSKHVLMLFDSCFSGSLFTVSRSLKPSPYISNEDSKTSSTIYHCGTS